MSKFFTTTQVNSYTTRITGLGKENAYLITGSERALLFDGLTGAGSLKAFVRELTDLPVFLVLSHGHSDHTGAAFEFGECFINPDDIGLMYSNLASNVEKRLNFVNLVMPWGPPKTTFARKDDIIPPVPVMTWPVYDGDIFDLGGVQLEVIQVPGHTRGSIVLLDRAARTVYSSDACNFHTLLNLSGSTTIEEYRDSLLRFKSYQEYFDYMYGGHGEDQVPASIIDDGIMLCEKIMEGTDDAVETQERTGIAYAAAASGENMTLLYGGHCNIIYAKDNIFGRKGSAVLTGSPYIDRG